MGARKAIITGSTKYTTSPLKYPQKDIEDITAVLRHRCKFSEEDINQVLHSNTCDDKTFFTAIEDQCHKLNAEKTDSYDVLVFYYSGHGFFDQARNTSCLQISDNYNITINEIIDCITEVKSKNTYIIIDACQSGGFSLMRQPKGKEERKLSYNSEGLYLLFGTTKELLAFEATTRDEIKLDIKNSFFTHFIIEALNTKSLYIDKTISIKVVDDYASNKTAKCTDFEQIPAASTQTKGYFPFGFWEITDELVDIKEWENNSSEKTKNPLPSREPGIIDIIEKQLKTLYSSNELADTLNSWQKDQLCNLSNPAKDLLNKKLGLVNKKYADKPLINGLIASLGSDRDKYNFLSCILEAGEIDIDVNSSDIHGSTALNEVFQSNDSYRRSWIVFMLFQRGYRMDSEEKDQLLQIIANNSVSPDIMTHIALSIIYSNLKTNEDRSRAYEIQNFLLSILSLKYNRVIGYRFANILALSNNALNSYKKFSTIYLKACKKYNRYDELISRQTFQNKVKSIQAEIPFQDSSCDEIIRSIFPELFN